jgi:hypothetical protein
LPESAISFFEQPSVWLRSRPPRNEQASPVKALKAVNQHWAVLLIENVLADLDDVVRPDPNYVPVEGGVVERAQREAVRDRWHAAWVRIRHDVGGVEQFIAAEAAYRAVVLVCAHDTFTELSLM